MDCGAGRVGLGLWGKKPRPARSRDRGRRATAIYEYVYDTFNRRIEKRLDTNGDLTVDQTERFILDGDHIALVFDGSNNLTNRYLHGPAIDQILADEDASGDVLWPLADNLGSIRDLAEYDSSTNATTIANHLIYDSYGNVTSESDDTVNHRFAFTGRERDEETNLQYHRRRYFDPATGNWLNPDPSGFPAGDVNLGRYVNNSPTNFVDPSGLEGLDIGVIPPEPDSSYGLSGSGLGPNPGDLSFGGDPGGILGPGFGDVPSGLGAGDVDMVFPSMEDIEKFDAAREWEEMANTRTEDFKHKGSWYTRWHFPDGRVEVYDRSENRRQRFNEKYQCFERADGSTRYPEEPTSLELAIEGASALTGTTIVRGAWKANQLRKAYKTAKLARTAEKAEDAASAAKKAADAAKSYAKKSKHTPGRGHVGKSGPSKTRRFQEKAEKLRKAAKKAYEDECKRWKGMSEGAKQLLPGLKPKGFTP